MKHTLALSMIPLAIAWVAAPKPAAPIAIPIAIAQVENITARRADSETFALRWRPVAELPPTVIKEVHHLVVASNEVVDAGTVAEPPAVPPSRQLEPRQVKRVALQTNVCTRHGMRKVQYGKRWRCRR